MTEKVVCSANETIINIHLLSQIDDKYSNLVISYENKSVNIVNLLTGTLYKITDTPTNSNYRDNMMQVVNKKNKDTFSFFIVEWTTDILKYTVKKSLLDLLV